MLNENESISLGAESVAWKPCHIGINTSIGHNVSIGALVHVGRNVIIGDYVRIQGGAYIADCCEISNNVFIGPNATLLNDRHPPSGNSKLWQPVIVGDSSVIGGGATIVGGVTIGDFAVLAAGAVATRNIPSREVWGGIPAKYLMSREQYEDNRSRVKDE